MEATVRERDGALQIALHDVHVMEPDLSAARRVARSAGELVAATGEVGALSGVACQCDGPVVGCP